MKKTILFLALCSSLFIAVACNNSAKDPKEASELLLAAPAWKIDQILVNDVVNFKDGRMIQQFGGVNFERYMETVRFKTNGNFEGQYTGAPEPTLLYWKMTANDIEISGADQSRGAWTISPSDVTPDSFAMKTQSTAYDFPRMTKVELKFKQVP